MENIIILKESKDSEISLLRAISTRKFFNSRFIEIREGLSLGWSDFLNVESVLFLNPCTDVELRIIKLIKSTSFAKVHIDWSIDPFSIPEDHSYYKYMNPTTDQIIKECLSLCDNLSCSNSEITNRLSIFSKGKSFTLETTTRDFPSNIFTQVSFSKNKTVLWRGKESYLKNLMAYIPQINSVGEKFPDWDFVFIGDIDSKYMKLPNHIPSKAIVPYLNNIKEINPAIMILPMEFDEYSRTRNADMFWESRLCGAVCLAPDLPSWQDKPSMLYNSNEGFEESLILLMSNDKLRKGLYDDI